MVAFSPELAEHSRALVEQKKYKFEILCDAGNEFALACGLRFELSQGLQEVYGQFGLDLPKLNGDHSWTLAMPGRYIVGRDGGVLYARVDPDYTRRPEPQETLEELKRLVG